MDGQPNFREAMHRLQERYAKDLFRHEATNWMDLVHQVDVLIRGSASGCPAVVVVQSSHHWKSDDLLACVRRGKR